MATLDGSSDLYALARAYLPGARPQRYHLFNIPAFVGAFRAMHPTDQATQWANLSVTRSGVPTTYTPQPVVDTWFLEFCRSPSTFSFEDHIWQVGRCCPDIWLRHQFASRMEAIKTMQLLPPTKSYHGPHRSKAGEINKRMRTAWQGVPSLNWLHVCTLKLVGELDPLEYQSWLGPADKDAMYPMLLIHEKNLQRGTFPKTRNAAKYLAHPDAVEQVKPTPQPKQAKQRKTKAIINPGRNAQIAALKRDSSARMEGNIASDLALIALGGSLKQLRDAMGARIGYKPRIGSMIAYLKYVLMQRQTFLDSKTVGPAYNGLFAYFAQEYERDPSIFKGMMPELGAISVGPDYLAWQSQFKKDIKKTLPRT